MGVSVFSETVSFGFGAALGVSVFSETVFFGFGAALGVSVFSETFFLVLAQLCEFLFSPKLFLSYSLHSLLNLFSPLLTETAGLRGRWISAVLGISFLGAQLVWLVAFFRMVGFGLAVSELMAWVLATWTVVYNKCNPNS